MQQKMNGVPSTGTVSRLATSTAIFAVLTALVCPAQAEVRYWKSSAGSINWFAERNWDGDLPTIHDAAHINAAWVEVKPVYGQSYAGVGSLDLTGGTHLVIRDGDGLQGYLQVTGIMYVGNRSAAQVTSYGGKNVVNEMILGYQGMGTYWLRDLDGFKGDLYTYTNLTVGHLQGVGQFEQSGNTTNEVAGDLYLAYYEDSSGSYDLRGGTLRTNNSIIGYEGGVSNPIVGRSSYATFTQNAGLHQVAGDLKLGQQAGGKGTYTLLGGRLETANQHIGSSGWGHFIQEGGANQVTGTLTVGYYGPTNDASWYEMNGGQLEAASVVVNRAVKGASFWHSGGQVTISGTLTLAQFGGDGIYHLSGTNPPADADISEPSSTLDVGNIANGAGTGHLRVDGGRLVLRGTTIDANRFSVGHSWNGNASFALNDGQSLSTVVQHVGKAGKGTIEQRGGSNRATDRLVVGDDAGSTGIYTLSGGQVVAGSETVGAHGTGVVSQDGGTNRTGTLELGASASGDGDYFLNDGRLGVDQLRYGAGSGRFIQNGGVVEVGTALTVSGAGNVYGLRGGELHAARIEVDGDAGFEFAGGQLSVERFDGTLVNAGGTLSPGRSAGTTHVSGDYDQASGAVLLVELGGLAAGEFDVLTVEGAVFLSPGARLDVVLLDGFSVADGHGFQIISARGFTGQFSFGNLPALPAPGLRWNLDQGLQNAGYSALTLSISAVPEPASWALLLAGAVFVLARVRKRSRAGTSPGNAIDAAPPDSLQRRRPRESSL